MEEDTYEHECMRAELLGIETPSLDEWLSKQKEREVVQEEDGEIEALQEAEYQNEELKNVQGGLTELGGILSATQKKINRFKASCGSLTNLLKIKMGSSAGSTESIVSTSGSKDEPEAALFEGIDNSSLCNSPLLTEKPQELPNGPKKGDLARALDHHKDSIDLLVEKSERCHMSMQHQNKQMRKFLN